MRWRPIERTSQATAALQFVLRGLYERYGWRPGMRVTPEMLAAAAKPQ